MRGEVKWRALVRQSARDILLMGFGGWIIWKEVYASVPNGYLILVGFACMVPSARSAIIAILSEPGSSSSSSSHQSEQQLPPGSQPSSGVNGEGKKSLRHSRVPDARIFCRERHVQRLHKAPEQAQVVRCRPAPSSPCPYLNRRTLRQTQVGNEVTSCTRNSWYWINLWGAKCRKRESGTPL